jgi:hypothetical protein
MSALRQRSGDKFESNKFIGKPAEGAGRKVDVAATPTYPFSWTFFGLVVVSLTMSLILFKLYPSESEQEYFVPSYALCSPGGRQIYTVDQSNTRVQCLVVHRSLIFDTGSLGTLIFCSSHKCTYLLIAFVRGCYTSLGGILRRTTSVNPLPRTWINCCSRHQWYVHPLKFDSYLSIIYRFPCTCS